MRFSPKIHQIRAKNIFFSFSSEVAYADRLCWCNKPGAEYLMLGPLEGENNLLWLSKFFAQATKSFVKLCTGNTVYVSGNTVQKFDVLRKIDRDPTWGDFARRGFRASYKS